MYLAAKVDKEKCIGCKMCITCCPEPNVFRFLPDEKLVEVDDSRCKACGLCTTICPKDALTLG